jgi:hypothetical protein
MAVLAGVAGCGGGVMQTQATGERLPSLDVVSQAQWTALAQRRIYFGHQSVGQNIVDGIADVLRAHPDIALRVVESKDFGSGPGFFHAKVGRNGYPLEKVDELLQVAERASGTDSGVAMVKLCYVDAQPNTDAQLLFDQYRQRMDRLRAMRPALTLVHFTMPLTVTESWTGILRKRLQGQWLERDRNLVRARYNRLLLAHYQGKEPVFDIARLESTRPDGSRLFFVRGADTVFTMVPEYAGDGNHLNEPTRRMVAEQLLVLLARLTPTAAPSQSRGS